MSTESGIPDYRGPGGRYTQTGSNPLTHQQFMGDERNRKRYWARSIIGFRSFNRAQPNRSHLTLAELERSHLINGLITQNVDRLHHHAGSKNLIELHGRGDLVECMTCGHQKDRAQYHHDLSEENQSWLKAIENKSYTLTADGDAIIDESDVPSFSVLSCEECAIGIIKPSFVFFGGSVPQEVAEAALDTVTKSKALLVIGTTASTVSCYRLVRSAKDQGNFIGIINQGHTRVDDMADAAFREASCGDFLQDLAKVVLPRQFGA